MNTYQKPVNLNHAQNTLCMNVAAQCSSMPDPSAALVISLQRIGSSDVIALAAIDNGSGKVCASATPAAIAAMPAGRYKATLTGWSGCTPCFDIEVKGACQVTDIATERAYLDCFTCEAAPVVVAPVPPATPPAIVRPIRVLL